jgi:hypothetical protein
MAKKDNKTEEVVEEVVEETPQEEPEGVALNPDDKVLNRLYTDGDGKRYVWTMKSNASEPSMVYIDK